MSHGTEPSDDAPEQGGDAAAQPHPRSAGSLYGDDVEPDAGAGEDTNGALPDWSSSTVQWTRHDLDQPVGTAVEQPVDTPVRRYDPLFDPLEPEAAEQPAAAPELTDDADVEQVVYTEPASYADTSSSYPQDPYQAAYQEPSTDLAQQFQPTPPAEQHEPQPAQQHYPQYDQPQDAQPQYDQQQYVQQQYDPQQYVEQQYDPQQYGQQQYGQQYYDQQQYGQYPQQPEQQQGYAQAQPERYPGGQHYAQPGARQPAAQQPDAQQPSAQQPSAQQSYAPPAPQAPPTPPRIPRPEDLLVPDQSPVTDQPASWGWRGKLHRASGGMFKPKAAEQELLARQAISDIQHGFSRPMTVVVVQPKGGAGKTPTTICLSAAFGAHRGGYVVGWDDNETRGTLAVRVSNPDSQRATVWDLLSDLAAFERFDARVGDLSRYVRPQPDAHFDALVSDDNPGNMAQIGENEFNRLHTVLQRFYRMIVVDTGNNVRSPNWQAAVNAADLIVVVSTYQRDVGYSGSWVLDHLAQTGREELARNAVTILSAADPTTDKTVREQLLGHFQARTRAVCEIPYDSEVAHGGPIRWTELEPETRNAWIRAGATVVNCLAEDDRRAVAARPS